MGATWMMSTRATILRQKDFSMINSAAHTKNKDEVEVEVEAIISKNFPLMKFNYDMSICPYIINWNRGTSLLQGAGA